MCYEASRMPMQPDRFSESQTVSTQTPSLLWRVLLGVSFSASLASSGLAVYETTQVRRLEIDIQNLRSQPQQLEGNRESFNALLQERKQPIAPGPVPSNSVSSPTKTNESVDGGAPTEDPLLSLLKQHNEEISTLKKQCEDMLIQISETKKRTDVQEPKNAELGTQIAGVKTMTEQMNRKIPDLELRCKATEDQLKKNFPELETRVGKCENLIKSQIQSLNALRLAVEARSKAKAKSTL